MELIFATNNQHKLEEVQSLIGSEFNLKSLNDMGYSEDIPETGHTFKANASQKTHFIFEHFNMNCFADDSGLEIDALNGEPGVYSARYSGSRDPKKNLELVLEKMQNLNNRKARFKTVISLMLNGKEYFFDGIAEGVITENQSGSEGFGYDPIFKPDGYEHTFAEMSLSEKNRISHRAKAMEKLISFLKEIQQS
ncbi:RdgB/HAM1 family non-canonical purine NTP pyrophosphatase [Daejeonella oryzae]|uniref:RdgB/HAM1 family non-canonical purine NTP pyrophosphatase n=1 Tax=Daejeonella oryzae TaxID=1122943 RepID=UPI000429FB73|nr:RdgB/HAM1 family non-canonical purine NTP pyrophosphatase [Daejeonella oryzae]